MESRELISITFAAPRCVKKEVVVTYIGYISNYNSERTKWKYEETEITARVRSQ